MTYISGTFADVALYERPVLHQGNSRRVIVGAFVVGFGTLVAAWAIAAVAAAWVVAASLATNSNVYQPSFFEKVPVASKTVALASPYGTLAGAADFSHWALISTEQGHTADATRAAKPSPSASIPRATPPSAPAASVSRTAAPSVAAASRVASPPAPAAPAPDVAPANSVPLPPSDPFFRPRIQAKNEIVRSSGRPTEPRIEPRIEPQQQPAANPPPRDSSNPFVKFFDALTHPSSGALANAGAEDGSISLPGAGSRTAVYDIAAHTVYMPDGERLEAHSGLGARIDDPSHVNEKNRGATPPHMYDLVLRRRLFHGVAALRLNPVGGGNMYGRTGLLAHTYMLGPNGQSNGCVSFRDYRKFLHAFLTGEVQRLVVVPHLGAAPSRVALARRARGVQYASYNP